MEPDPCLGCSIFIPKKISDSLLRTRLSAYQKGHMAKAKTDKRTVFETHRLNNMHFFIRQIAGQLGLDRGTVKKYLAQPDISCQKRPNQESKLNPFRDLIRQMVKNYPQTRSLSMEGDSYRKR